MTRYIRYSLVVMLSLAAIACKKDPYYNPDFKPQDITHEPVFYLKARYTERPAFITGDVMNATGGVGWDAAINYDTAIHPGTHSFGAQFRHLHTNAQEYLFFVYVNTPFSDKSLLLDYLKSKTTLEYATTATHQDRVTINIRPYNFPMLPKYHYSTLGQDTLNQNSTFEILSVEPYSDPTRPEEINLIKVHARFTCTTYDADDDEIIKLDGETVAMF